MIAILQRVKSASVDTEEGRAAEIGQGLLILLGVKVGDTEEDADLLINKIVKMRIFTDGEDKMNLSVSDIGGKVLVVPNFTLYASYRKGNRPDYLNSAPPAQSKPLFEYFCRKINEAVPMECGVFGAHMKVTMEGDGPVTIPMESAVLRKVNP